MHDNDGEPPISLHGFFKTDKDLEQYEMRTTRGSFYKTSLNGIDFTTSIIDGIGIDLNGIKGMIVSELQALELSKILGIIIK